MAESPANPTRHEIKIDLQGLIRLLAKNLYTEADVFIRELIQNAHDSLKRRAELEQKAPPGVIHIRTSRGTSVITVTDNGSGLTEQEVHDYLSTIGRSGTGEFRQELLKKGRQAEVNLIGQFGIGLLSAFVVAYKVEVETLSFQSGHPAWHWISEGQSDYELLPGSRQDIGTTVTLHIADNYRDMLNPDELRKAIKKYADFIPFQIFLNDEKAPANAVNAPWHRKFASENARIQDYASFVSQRFPDYILEVIPVELKTPYCVDGVLYISDRRILDSNVTGMVDIYQSRMFITSNNRDMLPNWAKFMRGVIDSPDLTPTASRDAIQINATAREIKEALGDLIVQHLKEMAERTPKRFERIMEWHSFHVKGMALEYDDFFNAIADLVPFETNRGSMNLGSYCRESLRVDTKTGCDIFYFSERGSATQFYMLCNSKGLLVINASYAFEEQFLEKYAAQRSDVRLHLVSGSGSEILFERLNPKEADVFRSLEMDFRRIMPDPASQVRIVRFKPNTLPAITILTPDAKLRQELEHTRGSVIIPESVRNLVDRMLQERRTLPIILHLNVDNPTIHQMAQMSRNRIGDSETYQSALHAIFNNAALLALHLMTPEMAQTVFNSSNQAIKLMIDQTEQLNDLQTRLSAAQLALREKEKEEATNAKQDGLEKHIICMVALPFRDQKTFAYETVLLPALREVLEQEPYYWQVARADEKFFEDTVERNVAAWMKRARAYIADISDVNPNVMMELGYMRWARRPGQPVIVLERSSSDQHLADLAGVIRISYPAASGKYAIEEIANVLATDFAKDEGIQKLNSTKEAHYLSPLLLRNSFGAKEELAEAVSSAYTTMENFVAASEEDIRRRIPGLASFLASGLQKAVAALLVNVSSG